MNKQQLQAKARSGAIDTVAVVFPDVFGRLVGKRFEAKHFLSSVAEHGTHACNYLLAVNLEMEPQEGFKLANWESGFGDFAMQPDLSTLRELPWQPGGALVLCDYVHPDGKLVVEAPRSVLTQQLALLKKHGLRAFLASELEFFLFNQSYHDGFSRAYRNLIPSSDYRVDYHILQPGRDEPLFRQVRNHLQAAGIPVECSKGEWGVGQHEINFVYDRALPMADKHVLFKLALKDIVAQQGRSVTFMAKPWHTEVGSSCHIHISLWDERKNLFWNGASKHPGASKVFRQFLGGLLKYSPELCCFFAPTINSYKRYQPASWAPTKMAWSHDNRTVGFRIVGEGNSFRIENRMPGADANPYLAYAAMIAAGLAGIEEKLDCGNEYRGNAYTDQNLPALPSSLREAATLLDRSRLARKAFGEEVTAFYVHTARLEAAAFDNAVTDWERMRYFEQI
jgi:glutamine synthetase